jgi:hypothetical protein
VTHDKQLGSLCRAAEDGSGVTDDRIDRNRHAIATLTVCCDGLVNVGLRDPANIIDELLR